MKLICESVPRLSRRLKIPKEELEKKLDIMKKKGQIRVEKGRKGKKKYGLLPFVVGIFEDQLHRMDKEFAEITEEFMDKVRGNVIFSGKPAITKVVPVKETIQAGLKIHPHSDAKQMIENAKSFNIRDCICRKHQELLDNRCNYPMSVCISLSSSEDGFEDSNSGRNVSKEEALQVLKEAEEAGLIHTTMNIQKDHFYICNCCACCCGILRSLTEYDQPNAIVNSDYVISIDEEKCIACGICIDRCQLDALEIVDDKCMVNDRCIGCGVCAITCPEDALELVKRPAKEIEKPPKNITLWMLIKSIKRKLNIFKIL